MKDAIGTDADLADFATKGLQDGVRRSTVGIVSGTDEHPWSGIGAGSLIRWGGQHLILTAEHVIAKTRREDLRFFFPFPLRRRRLSARRSRSWLARVSGLQAFSQIDLGRIVADADMDLAALAVNPDIETIYPAQFLDVGVGGQMPPEGTDVLATGFPRDIARQTKPGELVMFTHTEWTKVGPARELRNFDPSIHFLAAYLTATDYGGANPTGLSGSGVWFHRPAPGVWHPNLELAGLTVSWYPPELLLKMIRREAIERFLDAHWPASN